MKHISELRSTLSHFFDWHKSRLDCLGQIIQALFAVRTVNLTLLAAAFDSDVKEESSYRRICRFFTSFSIDLYHRSFGAPLISHRREMHLNLRSY